MTDKNKTHITFVVDRSGSMESVKDDAQGGLNALLNDQRKLPGECSLLLTEFDNIYNTVYSGDLKKFTSYTLSPRGGTALFDSMGRAIVETGQLLNMIPKAQRPGLVIFCVITDGEENSSREYSSTKIKEMVAHQTDVYDWKFTFLCSDMNTFLAAKNLNVDSVAAFHQSKFAGTYAATSGKFSNMRGMAAMGLEADNSYNDAQLAMMQEDKNA